MVKIEYVDYGIANNFGDRIEINKHLKNYPELLGPILKHEIEHTDKIFSWSDLKHDLISDSKLSYLKLAYFMFRHPKSFFQFIPIYYKNKKIVYDINLLIFYFVILGLIFLGLYLGNVFN